MIKRILCCGDRYWVNIPVTEQVIAVCVNKYGKEIAIIHGGCAGADYEAGSAALKHELTVWVEPAKWSLHGNSAGPIRNRLMLSRYKPHLVIAFHSNISKSKGTKHMVDIAEKAGVPVVIISGRADAENIHDKLPESLCPEITD